MRMLLKRNKMNIDEILKTFNMKGFYLRSQLAALIKERNDHLIRLRMYTKQNKCTVNVRMAISQCDEGIEEYQRQILELEKKND